MAGFILAGLFADSGGMLAPLIGVATPTVAMTSTAAGAAGATGAAGAAGVAGVAASVPVFLAAPALIAEATGAMGAMGAATTAAVAPVAVKAAAASAISSAAAVAPAAWSVGSVVLAGMGGLVGIGLVGGAAYYFLAKADASVPPAHAPRNDERYPCPEWLATTGQFNWGVVGESGTGKSTLINTLRGLRSWEKERGAVAAVGVVECTLKPHPYRFDVKPGDARAPKNLDKIRIWDIPGCGTPTFPADTYVANMGLRHFDGIIIVTANRFKQNDLMLMHTLRAFHVPFFMVRNKVDVDIEQNEEQNGMEEEATLKAIRDFMVQRQGINENLYLVSAAKALPTKKGVQMKLDFDLLVEDLLFEMSKGRTVVRAPPYWKDRALQGSLAKYPVLGDSGDMVHKILADMDLRHLQIASLARVESPAAFKPYFQKKDHMIEQHRKSRRPLPMPSVVPPMATGVALDSFVNEAWAWCEVAACDVERVLTAGLNAGAAHGAEIRLSTVPHKAAPSSKGDGGSRFLLLCRVILGQPFYPADESSPDLRRPPCTMGCESAAACEHPLADSVITSVGAADDGKRRHREITVYDGEQVYPEYVVEISS